MRHRAETYLYIFIQGVFKKRYEVPFLTEHPSSIGNEFLAPLPALRESPGIYLVIQIAKRTVIYIRHVAPITITREYNFQKIITMMQK